jgi:hypothetical protein
MKQAGLPLTRENYRFVNWLGTPPEHISAEEEAEIDEAFKGVDAAAEDKPAHG